MDLSELIHGVPLRYRRKSRSGSENMTPFDLESRNDSCSSVPSSPTLATPFASSSPPGRTFIHSSRRMSGQTGVSDYSDQYDDISTTWGRSSRRYGGYNKDNYAAMPATPRSYTSDGPSWTSELDASKGDRRVSERRYVVPDSDDEEAENGCHSRFALSSERGRWKSSPIPIKTHSRILSLPSTSPATRPLEKSRKRKVSRQILGKPDFIVDAAPERKIPAPFAFSPIGPSRSRRELSPLPPSSPPMSPVSIAQWMPEDDSNEEDMLIDDDDEIPQFHGTQSVKSQISSLLNPLTDPSESEADSEDQDDSLIPPIATLDFSFETIRASSPTPRSRKPTPTGELVAAPCPVLMPTPEATPAPPELSTLELLMQELPTPDPTPTIPTPEITKTTLLPENSIVGTAHTPEPASSNEPLDNTNNVSSADQESDTTPSIHMSMPAVDCPPSDLKVDVIPLTSALAVTVRSDANAVLTPAIVEPTVPLDPELSTTHSAPSPITQNSSPLSETISLGPSRPATPSSPILLSRKNSSSELRNVSLIDHASRPASPMNVDMPMLTAVPTKRKLTEKKDGVVKAGRVKEVKGNLKTRKETEKEKLVPGGLARRVVKETDPKATAEGPKARKSSGVKGSSSKDTSASMIDKAEADSAPDAKSRAKEEPAKRKIKGDTNSAEGPARKKTKVAKDRSVAIEYTLSAGTDESMAEASGSEKDKGTHSKRSRKAKPDPISSKPKGKKSKCPSSQPPSSARPVTAVPGLTPSRIAELQGMIIESFAVSRASSLPASSLYATMSNNRPSLKDDNTKVEWLTIIEAVLADGRDTSGMFGKVESSFKDDSDRALEAKWFYVPERDTDQERAVLISSMMPRAAKRTETKKYKQYYFQPLDKISRWDPEDDL